MTDFVPEPLVLPEGYRKDDITNAYADAAEQGLWIKEWAPEEREGDTTQYLAAVGSYYLLQKVEHDNPDLPEINPQEFGLADVIALAAPGAGASRVEAIHEGIEKFNQTPGLYNPHIQWHAQATGTEAPEPLPEQPDIIYTNTVDEGAWRVTVTRIDESRGVLTVVHTSDDKQILSEEVGLAYGAIYGPDVDDLNRWQDRSIEVIDAYDNSADAG